MTTLEIVLAASLLGPAAPVGPGWWYYDTGTKACAPGVSPEEMVRFILNMGQTPRVRHDGNRILVMKDQGDSQGLIFYRSQADCEADGKT